MTTDNRGPRAGGSQMLTIFACLWAAFIFFHLASYQQLNRPQLEAFAAVGLLLRPDSTIALVTLAAVQIYKAFRSMPSVPNHWLFAVFINAGLLASVAVVMLKQRRFTVDRNELYAVFAPAARLAVIALYFFAVFHKLNADWFDPRVSCAAMFWDAQLSRMPFLPVALHTASIYVSLGFEALIPLLFVFRRTRTAGILVGAGFHWFLGLNPVHYFYNFSSMLMALFVLFASPGLLADEVDRLGRRRLYQLSWMLAAVLIASALIVRSGINSWLGGVDLFLVLWFVYGAGLILAFALVLRRRRSVRLEPIQLFAFPSPVLVVLPLLVFANGLMPYVGLKTETSWAMFSNLRTEGGISNHWLVPASAQLFDYQQDLVEVVSSSDRNLQSLTDERQLVPYFELRRRPDASISYLRDGVEYSFSHVADDPAYPGRVPGWLAKFMWFGPVDPTASQPCEH